MSKVITGFRAQCRISARRHNVTVPAELCILECPVPALRALHSTGKFLRRGNTLNVTMPLLGKLLLNVIKFGTRRRSRRCRRTARP